MIQTALSRNIEVVLVAAFKLSIFGSPPDFYERLAEKHGILVDMDTLGALGRDRSMKSASIHLNVTGHQKLAEAIERVLEKHGALYPSSITLSERFALVYTF